MENIVRRIKPRRKTSLKKRIKGRTYDVLRDVPDIRDRIYEPMLQPLPPVKLPPKNLRILDQGDEGACTGFSLAATINLLMRHRAPAAGAARDVSPHMLYSMARRYDEWPGDKYDGSSLRGALRGFYNCGACRDRLWPEAKQSEPTIDSAKDARSTALGAYYRLRPTLADYHAAINETGAIYVSASVHGGWDKPVKGYIEPRAGAQLHAFVIVGYDADGFWVQNSWGKGWGRGGLGHWAYKDWAANIEDAWVLQLAVPAPSAFGLGVKRDRTTSATELSGSKRAAPPRQDIAGHFVHVQNGDFSAAQPYWSTKADVEITAELVGKNAGGKYDDFLFYAHGGLNSPEDAAIRTAAMTEVFMANGIYPYSVFYDTGLLQTLGDVITGRGAAITQRTGGLLDLTDELIEKAVGGIGTKLWREMKADASLPFQPARDGETALRLFAAQLKGRTMPIHLVGHSTGAVLIGNVLDALDRVVPDGMTIDSCSLMAPACSVDFFNARFKPRLGPSATTPVKLGALTIYSLDDTTEQADTVTPAYNKSLLYLVSDAFEDRPKMPILGMQKFQGPLKGSAAQIWYSSPDSPHSRSTSHGGFDNDPFTMNDILRNVLGKKPTRPFSSQDLDY